MQDIAVVILAAGKGTRLNSTVVNKVTLPLAGRPMISYIVDTLRKIGLINIFVVIGFARRSVTKTLRTKVSYVIQGRRSGTASAVRVAMEKIKNFKTALVLQCDDSAFYTPKLIRALIAQHQKTHPVLTMLTIVKQNPSGLGRILRKGGKVTAIVEEKNATESQRQIKEINAACYVFSLKFLKKYLPKVKKNPIKREYYLTDLIELAVCNELPISTLQAPEELFMGVNTQEELIRADTLMTEKLRGGKKIKSNPNNPKKEN